MRDRIQSKRLIFSQGCIDLKWHHVLILHFCASDTVDLDGRINSDIAQTILEYRNFKRHFKDTNEFVIDVDPSVCNIVRELPLFSVERRIRF